MLTKLIFVCYNNHHLKDKVYFERSIIMPKTKLQDVIFTIIMVIVMVYGMVVYNIAWSNGGLEPNTFYIALFELPIMVPIAFILEFFFVGNIVKKTVFRHMNPNDKPIFITFFISALTVAWMCPLMSAIATIIFNGATPATFASKFFVIFARNIPMEFFWQLFYAGPLVRLIFTKAVLPILHIFEKDIEELPDPDPVYAEEE